MPYTSVLMVSSINFHFYNVDQDSMPPHQDGDVIVGKYIERLGEIVNAKTFVIVTKNDGIA